MNEQSPEYSGSAAAETRQCSECHEEAGFNVLTCPACRRDFPEKYKQDLKEKNRLAKKFGLTPRN